MWPVKNGTGFEYIGLQEKKLLSMSTEGRAPIRPFLNCPCWKVRLFKSSYEGKTSEPATPQRDSNFHPQRLLPVEAIVFYTQFKVVKSNYTAGHHCSAMNPRAW